MHVCVCVTGAVRRLGVQLTSAIYPRPKAANVFHKPFVVPTKFSLHTEVRGPLTKARVLACLFVVALFVFSVVYLVSVCLL